VANGTSASDANTSALARIISNVLIAGIGGALVTALLRAFGMRRLALGALVGAVMIVVHERLDSPVARLLTRWGTHPAAAPGEPAVP
jgi:hypothetical protein